MERLTCNELKTIRDGFFIHKGNREDGAKYRMLAESAPKYEEIYRKLAEYEDAEEQGLLLRLPCKVGTSVYMINHYWIDEGRICGIAEADDIDCFCYKVYCDPDDYTMVAVEEFNKTWFLTYEEAEKEITNKLQSHAESIMDERNGR